MKRMFLLLIIIYILIIQTGFCDTTVDDKHKYSWGANIGWINWQGDITNGAVFTQNFASGYIWSANIGWINLGDGSPSNGQKYSNITADDFGINVDAVSDPNYFILSGYAYSANAGWINFDVLSIAGSENQPKIEKQTGILKGYAWGANIGWLTLESPGIADVETGLMLKNPNIWFIY